MSTMGEFCPGPEALAGWLEHRLQPADRSKVTSHLASCDECRRAVTIASAVDPQPEGAVDEALLRRVVSQSHGRSVRAWIAAAAAVAMGAILLWPARPKPAENTAATPPAPPPATAPKEEIARPVPPPTRTPEPAPAPLTEPPPVKPEPAPAPKKEEPPKTVVAKETSPAVPPAPAKEDPAPAVKKTSGTTEVDTTGLFASVFVLDPSGDLWLHRQGAEAALVGRYEHVGQKDVLSTRDAPGAFALEGKATLALDRNTAATVAWKPADKVYALEVAKGTVMIDTEGASHGWKVSSGKAEFVISNVNGRFAIEPRGEQLAAVMLAGRADVKSAAAAAPKRLDAGREMLVAPDGKPADQAAKSDTQKRLAKLAPVRPRELTVFSATFKDKEKEEPLPFAYSIPHGKVISEGSLTFLHAEVPAGASVKSGEKTVITCSVKPERPIEVSSTMVLRFRFRSNLQTFTILLDKYSVAYTPHLKAGEWGVAEIPLETFACEGVFLSRAVQGQLTDIQFQAGVDAKKIGLLDVDGIHFVRRSR